MMRLVVCVDLTGGVGTFARLRVRGCPFLETALLRCFWLA